MKQGTIYTDTNGESYILLGGADAVHIESGASIDARTIEPWFGGLNPRRKKGGYQSIIKVDWKEISPEFIGLLKPIQIVEFEYSINGKDMEFKGGFALFGKKLVTFKRTAKGKAYYKPFFDTTTAWILGNVETLSDALVKVLESYNADVFKVDDKHFLIRHGERIIFSLINRAYVAGSFSGETTVSAQPKADRDIVPDMFSLGVYAYGDIIDDLIKQEEELEV